MTLIVMSVTCLLVLGASGTRYFEETFSDGDGWQSRWTQSDWHKEDGKAGQFELRKAKWSNASPEGIGLATAENERYYMWTAPFLQEWPGSAAGRPLVIQFSVQHEQELDCGGAYVKLYSSVTADEKSPRAFTSETPFSVLFGPEICASHLRHVQVSLWPSSSPVMWIGLKQPGRTAPYLRCYTDQAVHTYTLEINPADSTFAVYMDGVRHRWGSMRDWIEHPERRQERETRPPPANGESDVKAPARPISLTQEEERAWAANFDLSFPPISRIGFEFWQSKAGSVFDNIIITDSVEDARSFKMEHFPPPAEADQRAGYIEYMQLKEAAWKRSRDEMLQERTRQDVESSRRAALGSGTAAPAVSNHQAQQQQLQQKQQQQQQQQQQRHQQHLHKKEEL